jgi:hypothetical protein
MRRDEGVKLKNILCSNNFESKEISKKRSTQRCKRETRKNKKNKSGNLDLGGKLGIVEGGVDCVVKKQKKRKSKDWN